ncbi:NAD(+) synthase [Mycoplasmopsis agassizii]|uniref:NAD(+) synthase n=1 Tax=Mycoplasmopsis agassizii TaxID=33922 RepID=UPI003529931B
MSKNLEKISEEKLKAYGLYLEKWLLNVVTEANKKGVIVGLSGGIDSALVAAIAAKVFPKNHFTVSMMINKRKQDELDINELVSKLKLKHQYLNLENAYKAMVDVLKINDQLALANIKPRLRMTSLYALAQEKNYLVLGTDNLDEWHLGYFTKFGDGGVDLLPIVHLTKTEVRKLAKIYGVTKTIINKVPSAGLWDDQNDEDEMQIKYSEVDAYLRGQAVEQKTLERINYLHKISAHKRVGAAKPLDLENFVKES